MVKMCKGCRRGVHCFTGGCGCDCRTRWFRYDKRRSMERLYE
jgi:hypothetical protein